MPLYENVFIVRQDASTQQVEGMTDHFSGIVRDQGGEVAKTEHWGLKTMAYRIKKNRKGHYVMMNLDAAPSAVAELERNLRLNEDVLRYMTIRVDKLEEGPSAMMRAKSGREDRRGDGDRGPARGAPPRAEGGAETAATQAPPVPAPEGSAPAPEGDAAAPAGKTEEPVKAEAEDTST